MQSDKPPSREQSPQRTQHPSIPSLGLPSVNLPSLSQQGLAHHIGLHHQTTPLPMHVQVPMSMQQIHTIQPVFLVPVGYAPMQHQQPQQQQQFFQPIHIQQHPQFAHGPEVPHISPVHTQAPQLPHQQRNLSPCYCGTVKEPNILRPSLQCRKCTKSFHHECIESFKTWTQAPFLGDDFYIFLCKDCNASSDGKEEKIQRQPMILADIAHLALFQFTYQSAFADPASIVWSRDSPSMPPAARVGPDDDRKYFTRKQVAAFVDANWDRFWLKIRSASWTHSLMSAIVGGGGGSTANSTANIPAEELRFLPGREQFPGESTASQLLALFDKTVSPSSIDAKRVNRLAAFDILPDGTLVDLPGAPPRPPQPALPPKYFSESNPANSSSSANSAGSKKKDVVKRQIESIAENPDLDDDMVKHDESKKPRQVKPKPQPRILEPEEVDANNSVLLYPDLNNPERGPVTLSNELTHTAPQMKLSDDGLTVFTDKGYRMSKATHGVYEGCWYFEVTFNSKEKGHARVGWSQISGDLQAPCGYDQFSYSYRDSPGTLFHESRPVIAPENDKFSEGFSNGDVLGLMISLPPPSDMDNMVRRLWKSESSYVQFRTKPLVKMPGSEIKYFKNGVELGIAFTDLYNGKYYPAVSSYMHGTLNLNFGPNFKHPLPPNARPYSDVPKVFAWSDMSLYSYEPFFVYEKEFPAKNIPPPSTQYLPSSPPGKSTFKFREFGKPKRRKLVKKRAVESGSLASASAPSNEISGERVSSPDMEMSERDGAEGGSGGKGSEDEDEEEGDSEGEVLDIMNNN